MVPSEFAISTNYGILIVVLCCIVIEPWKGSSLVYLLVYVYAMCILYWVVYLYYTCRLFICCYKCI